MVITTSESWDGIIMSVTFDCHLLTVKLRDTAEKKPRNADKHLRSLPFSVEVVLIVINGSVVTFSLTC